MSSDSWEAYKAIVQNIRDTIAFEYKQLYAVLEKCTCDEKQPRVTHSRDYDTFFDECVVCLKIHNVRSNKQKPTEAQILKKRERNKARRAKRSKKTEVL